jgi:hypothetical protein
MCHSVAQGSHRVPTDELCALFGAGSSQRFLLENFEETVPGENETAVEVNDQLDLDVRPLDYLRKQGVFAWALSRRSDHCIPCLVILKEQQTPLDAQGRRVSYRLQQVGIAGNDLVKDRRSD